MRLTLREIRFDCDPADDKAVFIAWEKGELSVEDAARRFSRNNGIEPPLDNGEFVQMAHNLGYWKELPFDIRFAIQEYAETHAGQKTV